MLGLLVCAFYIGIRFFQNKGFKLPWLRNMSLQPFGWQTLKVSIVMLGDLSVFCRGSLGGSKL